MGRAVRIVITGIAVCALAAPTARADERASWGVVVSVGTEDSTLLLDGDRGGRRSGPLTLTDIRPGDRVDYAWSPWAGMAVADVVHVTPRRLLGERRPEAPRPPSRPLDQPAAGGMTFLK
jgi:hypothetical protein